jgi:ribosomal protein S18 acetylase RimI-like enzyme
MQTIIRPAAPADAPAIGRLMAQLAEFCHGSPDGGVAERLRIMAALPDHAVFVAEDGAGQIVGLLTICHRWTLWHAGPAAVIDELVVDRAARGRGVGRALIGAALDWAGAHGCAEVEVSTEVDNTEAAAFYRRLGFTQAALRLECELEEQR